MKCVIAALLQALSFVANVNGLNVARELHGLQASSEGELNGLPNDHWILNGENGIDISVLPTQEVTETTIRTEQAKKMQLHMDMLANPCEDFYQYACGNWEKNHPIPDDHFEYNVFSLLQKNLHSSLKKLLEESPSGELDANNESSAEDKAKYFYLSCINSETRTQRGEKPLLEFLSQYGSWPALPAGWTDDNFNWINLAAELSKYMPNNLIQTSCNGDLKDSAANIIYLDEPTLTLTRRDLYLLPVNSTYMVAYKDLIKQITMLLGVGEEAADTTADEILTFERNLANIKSSTTERMELEDMYNKMNVSSLISNFADIDWMKYLQTIYGSNVTEETEVVLLSPKYMKLLPGLILITEKRILANYLLWRYVKELSEDLDSRFEKLHANFSKLLTGQEDDLPKWKTCMQYTNRMMGMAVGAMFVRRHFDESSKTDVMKLTQELQQAFRDALRENTWIDRSTRDKAEEKVNKMVLAVGYPDEILNSTKLNEMFAGLNITSKSYFQNSLNLAIFQTKRSIESIGKPVDKEEWAGNPAVINAYFEQSNNRIIIPAGVLQPPIYNKDFPRALSYAGIGIFVGHELTHGFDDTGRNFDLHGDMKQWWTEDSIAAFKEHSDCFIDQYSQYSLHDKSINGALSKGENIADNGGLAQAYHAYEKWLKEHPDELVNEFLPGVNITGKKLFYLGFAQVWCGTIRPEAIENKLETDSHSPGKYRVLGTLRNFDEFAKEFQCPLGSGMNPIKRCKLW